MKRRAQILVECLKKKVEVLFGYPGEGSLHL